MIPGLEVFMYMIGLAFAISMYIVAIAIGVRIVNKKREE